MASGKSNYLANKILDLIFGAQAFTAPVTVYAALFTTTPTAANSGVEVSGSNYSRVAVTNNLTNFPAASSQTKQNATAITFPVLSGAVATVVSVGFYDASSGGNLLYWTDLAGAYQKSYVANDQPVIPAAAFTATEA